MNALVVFCELPEDVRLFVLNDIDEATRMKLLSFHGVYIGSAENNEDLQDEVSQFFLPDGTHRFQRVERPIVDERFDVIVQCGLYL